MLTWTQKRPQISPTAQNLSFPVLLDPRERVAKAYERKSLPTTFIIDKKGNITYGHVGYDNRTIPQLARELGIALKELRKEAQMGAPAIEFSM